MIDAKGPLQVGAQAEPLNFRDFQKAARPDAGVVHNSVGVLRELTCLAGLPPRRKVHDPLDA
jgi:hypothetical protein